MKMNYCLNAVVLGLFLALPGGCSSIEDPLSPGAAIWELRGSISNPGDNLEPSNVRAVLVWDWDPYPHTRSMDEEPRFVQDVPINPEFPANFTIEMTELPPEDMVTDNAYCSANGRCVDCRTANAKLLIYEDRNGNDKLDFLPFEADETIDRVIGPKEWYDIVYLDSDEECDVSEFWGQSGGDDIKYRPGFNVIKTGCVYRQGATVLDKSPSPCDPWTCVGEPSSPDEPPVCEVTVEGDMRLFSKGEALELTLEDDLYQQFLVCLGHCDIVVDGPVVGKSCSARARPTEDWEYLGWLPIDEIAADSQFFCYDEGHTLAFKSFIDTQYEEGGRLCGLRTEEYVYGKSSIGEDEAIPEAWPCEVEE